MYIPLYIIFLGRPPRWPDTRPNTRPNTRPDTKGYIFNFWPPTKTSHTVGVGFPESSKRGSYRGVSFFHNFKRNFARARKQTRIPTV